MTLGPHKRSLTGRGLGDGVALRGGAESPQFWILVPPLSAADASAP